MAKVYQFTFLLSLLCLGVACDDNSYDKSNYRETTNQHNYNTSPSDTNRPIRNVDEMNPQVSGYEESSARRDYWQNPSAVMNKLGDLQGKVVADIGAGQGYFSLYIAKRSKAQKVIAIDIDKEAIQFVENMKITLDSDVRSRIETRLVEPHDPNLKDGEANIVLMVNTYPYIENPIDYLKNLKRGIAKDGKLVIVDYKKRNTPGPPASARVAIGELELALAKAGYVEVNSDDQSLSYQYIVTARLGLDR